jgi:hypothetical protein
MTCSALEFSIATAAAGEFASRLYSEIRKLVST